MVICIFLIPQTKKLMMNNLFSILASDPFKSVQLYYALIAFYFKASFHQELMWKCFNSQNIRYEEPKVDGGISILHRQEECQVNDKRSFYIYIYIY